VNGCDGRAETERAEWMKERDEKLENMSTKLKELKTSLKERSRVVEELERRLSEQTVALETSKSRVTESEAGAAELQIKLTEMRRTVDERDEQLQMLHDELTAVCMLVINVKFHPCQKNICQYDDYFALNYRHLVINRFIMHKISPVLSLHSRDKQAP